MIAPMKKDGRHAFGSWVLRELGRTVGVAVRSGKAINHPENTRLLFDKRFMGRRFSTKSRRDQDVPYKVVQSATTWRCCWRR